MRRGEVWWALLAPKTRPVVIVSRDSRVAAHSLLLAAPVTARPRGLESQVLLDREDGLPKPCAVDAGALFMVKRSQLIRRIVFLPPAKRDALDAALRFSLGLD